MMALENLLVLDASRILAGPFCGQFFADHGAEVIKIEAPDGDANRVWPLVVNGASTNFFSVNRGKKSLTLNLREPDGRKILHDLVRRADVLIHNYLPETAAKLGVDDAALAQLNEGLIRVVVGGYGARGKLAGKPGYDAMMTGFSGIMSLTGEPDRPPVKPGISMIDMSTGMLAFAGAMTALYARAAGAAKGQRIDVSLLETAVSQLGFRGLNFLMGGQVDKREGADFGSLAPYGRYRAADGDIMLGAPTPATWQKLCQVIGAEWMLTDARYLTNDLRCANEAVFRVDFEKVLATRTVAAWVEMLDAVGIANAPVHTVDQVLQHQQVLDNDMVVEARSSDGRTHRLLGLPFKMSGTPGAIGPAPPELGEHTAAILQRHLGYTEEKLAALRARGVV